MKSFTRKTVSLLLVAAFVIALALSAFAAVPDEDEVTPTAQCNHIYDAPVKTLVRTYVYHSASEHGYYYNCVEICRLCKFAHKWTALATDQKRFIKPHNNYIADATCNGTTQTWRYYCSVCNHATQTTYNACKGAPHGTVCHWLPI